MKNPILFELCNTYGMKLDDESLIGKEGRIALEIEVEDKFMVLDFIFIEPQFRQKGYGDIYLKRVTDLADKYGYTIDLHVDAKFGVSEEVLIHFYKKHGFIWANNENIMFRPYQEVIL